MSEYGTLHESNDHYVLRFERSFSQNPHDVFRILTTPDYFVQWYPFATGEMDLKPGGEISFDDGEGTTYKGIITEIEEPVLFGFREEGDLIRVSIEQKESGSQMTFTHTFDDNAWAVNTAAGWHRCLDVFDQIVNEHPVEWKENAADLRAYYQKAFN
ncbi:SRPBCC family protein [Jeotgalibacillus salarius]|uniref:SRPBCC family protein n=1 Tax=Jeotgalibacillus salarius TaxID=546023 RepID=A0A4Y8LHV3_9BACL|nr:SRPBCC family protein [Jeotgalibacillus salarius]TFE00635.1 SRPBCC family protein [Jeotgalibacillus salarius]